MSVKGVWQLQTLTLRYCKHSGSSKGVREYLRDGVIDFAKANPQVQVRALLRPNRHPVAVGDYVDGASKVQDLKNKSFEDVAKHVQHLRDTTGKRIVRHHRPVKSTKPSIQGTWNPSTVIEDFALDA